MGDIILAQVTDANSHRHRSPLASGFALGLRVRGKWVFSFKCVGGFWSLVFNKRCGIVLDPGMARTWAGTGMRRHDCDSPDGRCLGVAIPCAGRGCQVLSLAAVYGPVSRFGFDQERLDMLDFFV